MVLYSYNYIHILKRHKLVSSFKNQPTTKKNIFFSSQRYFFNHDHSVQVTPRKRKKQPGFQNSPAQNPPFVPMYFHEMAFRHQKITQSLSSFVHHPFGSTPQPPLTQPRTTDDDGRDTPPHRTPIYMGRSRSQDSGVYRPPPPPPLIQPPPPPQSDNDCSPPPPSGQSTQSSSFGSFSENGSPWKPSSGTLFVIILR